MNGAGRWQSLVDGCRAVQGAAAQRRSEGCWLCWLHRVHRGLGTAPRMSAAGNTARPARPASRMPGRGRGSDYSTPAARREAE